MDVIAFFQSANIFLSVSSDGGYCSTLLLLPDIKQFQHQGRNPGPASWRKPHTGAQQPSCKALPHLWVSREMLLSSDVHRPSGKAAALRPVLPSRGEQAPAEVGVQSATGIFRSPCSAVLAEASLPSQLGLPWNEINVWARIQAWHSRPNIASLSQEFLVAPSSSSSSALSFAVCSAASGVLHHSKSPARDLHITAAAA